MKRNFWLILCLLNFILTVACNDTQKLVATPEVVKPTITMTSIQENTTITKTFEPIFSPTLTPIPQEVSIVSSEIEQICKISQPISPQIEDQALYFQMLGQGWYRTTDMFVTTEQITPEGFLSPDLKNLITFDCAGPGSICVASPPQTTPTPLPIHYEPEMGGVDTCVDWLANNQQIIFRVTYRAEEGGIDVRLYLLDLQNSELYQITDKLSLKWSVFPLNSCVAYTAYNDVNEILQFHLTNVEHPEKFQTWSTSIGESDLEWPTWQDPIAWSPDGRYLAFVKHPEPAIVVWEPLTNIKQVYKTKTRAWILKWSPDSKKIYFISGGSQNNSSHWVLDTTSGKLQEVAEESSTRGSCAYQWLPNNEEIIVPDRFGSVILNTLSGSKQELSHPIDEKRLNITNMFFGPISP